MGISNAERLLIEATVWAAGFDGNDWRQWRRKYTNLRSNAKLRDAECHLTFVQYMKLAKRAKLTRPDDIGKAPHHYAMARKGDAGDYEVGNCRFITVEQNTWEKTVNGGSYVAAEKLRGRTKENDPSVARSAEKLRGRTKSTHVGYQIVSEARSKPFAVLSPRGKKYVGRNVKEFAAKHGLNQSELSKVFRGAVAHHKGWTGYYTD